jgi:hypothetical protein
MSWKSHFDTTVLTEEQHLALSEEEKIKYYEISEEEVTEEN